MNTGILIDIQEDFGSQGVYDQFFNNHAGRSLYIKPLIERNMDTLKKEKGKEVELEVKVP